MRHSEQLTDLLTALCAARLELGDGKEQCSCGAQHER
jgi:hypothetical protein